MGPVSPWGGRVAAIPRVFPGIAAGVVVVAVQGVGAGVVVVVDAAAVAAETVVVVGVTGVDVGVGAGVVVVVDVAAVAAETVVVVVDVAAVAAEAVVVIGAVGERSKGMAGGELVVAGAKSAQLGEVADPWGKI